MALYASPDDMLAALSQDSQAKTTTDPSRRVVVGSGDGIKTTFLTPFKETTAAKGFLDGAPVDPAPTLSRGTGTGGRDEVVFSAPPPAGKVVAVSADASAINVDVIVAVLQSISDEFDGYLSALLPITSASLLATLKAKAILFGRVRLRGRRNLDVVDPIEWEYKAALRWFEGVAKGDIVLWTGETDPETEADGLVGSEPPVFGPPNDPEGDW